MHRQSSHPRTHPRTHTTAQVNGVRYFRTEPDCGLFVRPSSIAKLDLGKNPLRPSHKFYEVEEDPIAAGMLFFSLLFFFLPSRSALFLHPTPLLFIDDHANSLTTPLHMNTHTHAPTRPQTWRTARN